MSTKDTKNNQNTTDNTNTNPVDGVEKNTIDNEITEDKSIEINNEEEKTEETEGKGLLEDMEDPSENKDKVFTTIILCGLSAILTAIITTLVVSAHLTTTDMNTEVSYKSTNFEESDACLRLENTFENNDTLYFYERYTKQIGTTAPTQRMFTGTLVKDNQEYKVGEYGVTMGEYAETIEETLEENLSALLFDTENIYKIVELATGYEVYVSKDINDKHFEGSYTLLANKYGDIEKLVGNITYTKIISSVSDNTVGGSQDIYENYYIEIMTDNYKNFYIESLPKEN